MTEKNCRAQRKSGNPTKPIRYDLTKLVKNCNTKLEGLEVSFETSNVSYQMDNAYNGHVSDVMTLENSLCMQKTQKLKKKS